MNYARGIATARTRRGLSKRKLAQLAGLTPSYLTNLEAGKKTPSLNALEALARALDLPMHLLMLLSSEQSDLQGARAADADALSAILLDLLPAGADDR